jgi:Flp pilus assembly protein TadB
MKKLFMMFVLALFTVVFAAPTAYAGVSVPSMEEGVVPVSKKEKLKAAKKQIKELRKEYRKEMKGMTIAQKKAFMEDKIGQSTVDIGNVRYLILALICFLIAGLAWVLPYPIDWILSTIFGIVGVVFLVLWLLELLQSV